MLPKLFTQYWELLDFDEISSQNTMTFTMGPKSGQMKVDRSYAQTPSMQFLLKF